MEAGSELSSQNLQLRSMAHSTDSASGKRMRVLLDARKLEDGGIGTYIRNLVTGILAHDLVDLTLLANPAQVDKYQWKDWVNVLENYIPTYSLREYFSLGKIVNAGNFDLFHVPHYTLPFGIKIPTVVTIHDVIHIKQPEKEYYPYLAKPLINSAIKRASRVLTVSQATYADLVGICSKPELLKDKLRVIPNALDATFLERISSGNFEVPEIILHRYKLDGPYLLTVLSNSKPHKGIPDLVRAFESLKQRYLGGTKARNPQLHKLVSDLKLALVGQGSEDVTAIESALKFEHARQDIRFLGVVPRDDLYRLYLGAYALVVPSLAEGFCLPALEAKACGTPVIARPIAALNDFLDDEDWIAGDFTVAALEQRILEFLSASLHVKLIRDKESVLRRVSGYLTQDVGRAIIELYQETIRSCGERK